MRIARYFTRARVHEDGSGRKILFYFEDQERKLPRPASSTMTNAAAMESMEPIPSTRREGTDTSR